LSRLDSTLGTTFDIAIIGGGIIGCGIARDAALRGLSVALFEQHDYGSGTTSGSSRLIHGGLRYLEMFDFGLVRMDLRERETLLRIAPHLVKPLEFLVPFYGTSWFYRAKMRAGMILYDLLSHGKTLPNHRMLSAKEVLKAEPLLKAEGLRGAACYFDAQVESPERLAVENITGARDHGARTFNYAAVEGALQQDGRITGVRVRDRLEDSVIDVKAKVVVNASGPWFDRVASHLVPGSQPRVRTTKGVHLACAHPPNRAVVLFSPVDRRLFFVIPLRGFAWVSTTDTDFRNDPSEACASAEDVDYLMRSASAYIPVLNDAPVFWTNAGIRALVSQGGSESSVSRAHKIESRPGLVSVLGGKITGYRAIAEEATDAVEGQLGAAHPCTTARHKLPGMRSPLEEQCVHLADFMMRRTSLSFTPDQGRGVVENVARLLAVQLGWSAERTYAEVHAYLAEIGNTYLKS